MKKAWNYILGFESYREQICKLRIRGKYNKIHSFMYMHLQKIKQMKI
jgi:hypothetical protein